MTNDAKPVRVRFAPSPTGNPHVGNFRTALFNYLFARHNGGQFLLRIEDTDKARSEKRYEDAIFESLEWMGLEPDEPPVRQSERIERHKEEANRLLAEGKAYRCRCPQERIEALREEQMAKGLNPGYDGLCRNADYPDDGTPFCVRLKTPREGSVVIEDPVRGPVTVRHEELDDLVILRTGGFPTYNFAVVVDDHDMGITHVIRGDDHLRNSARQVPIFEALGYGIPEFVHLPQILGKDKARLSKRHGAAGVLEYREQGYLPEALVNYLARLGWSHGDDEFFNKEDLIRLFTLDHVNKAAGVFDPEKLIWLNGEHIRALDPAELGRRFAAYAGKHNLLPGLDLSSDEGQRLLPLIVDATRERSRTLAEMAQNVEFLLKDELEFDPKDVKKMYKPEAAPALESLADFAAANAGRIPSHEEWEAAFKEILERHDLKMRVFAQAVRLALTGTPVSPPIFHVLDMLGTGAVERRLRRAMQRFSEMAA